jgi:RHS repeat-associated protein
MRALAGWVLGATIAGMLLGTGAVRAQSAGTTLAGPFTVTLPSTQTFSFSTGFNAPPPLAHSYVLRVGLNPANSLTALSLRLNNNQIYALADFAGGVTSVDKVVTLLASNTIALQVAGAKGTRITIAVFTVVMPKPVSLSPSPLALNAGGSGTLTATLSPAPTASGTLNITSGNAAAASVPTSISFASGQTSVAIPVSALAGGSSAVTASANGGQVQATVNVNALPTASLVAPAVGGVYNAPASITVTANAADSDGTVAKVDFFDGATLVGTASAAPFSVTLANVAAGTHTYTARATDNLGATSTSAAITVTVDAPPVIALTAPANNAIYAAPATVTLTATATDAVGTVTRVDFYQGAILIGTATAAPFTFNWTSVAAGSYSLTAVATNDAGMATTSPAVAITVDAAPSVAISSPANGASFSAPANISLTATTADTVGTITRVDFYQGTTLIGTAGSAPYSFNWTNVAAGNYSLIAVATNDSGQTTTSAAIGVTVRSATAQIYYVHPDHLNTPRMIADSAGTTVWKWDQQEPFGSTLPNDNPSGLGAFDFPLRLPGQYYDQETALHYNIMRDYDPSIGRYVEGDPIGLAGGISIYAYVLANPLLHTDIAGLRLGDVPSQSPEDLLKKGPGRIGNSLAADFWGKYYGIKCAERCKVSAPTWVRMNALQLCVDEIIPPLVQASTFGGTVVQVCTKTCYEQVPKICSPNACLPGVSDIL